MFCPQCGANVPDGDRSCPSCGAAVQTTAQPASTYSPPPAAVLSRLQLAVAGGFAAAALGTRLDWVNLRNTVGYSGWACRQTFQLGRWLDVTGPVDAVVVVVLAAVGAYLFIGPFLGLTVRAIPLATAAIGVTIAVVGALQVIYIQDVGRPGFDVDVGIGLYVVMVGGAAAAVCALVERQRQARLTTPAQATAALASAGAPKGPRPLSPLQLGVAGGFAVAVLGTVLDWLAFRGIGGISAWDCVANYQLSNWLDVEAPIDATVVVVLAGVGTHFFFGPLLGLTVRANPLATVAAGATIATVAALQFLYVQDIGRPTVHVGIGVYVVMVGGAAAAICALVEHQRQARL